MIIGLPREIWPQEGRVGLVPSGVQRLVRAGHHVIVQQGAGLESGLLDDEYLRAGAELVASLEDIYARATLVWKVEAPTGPEPRLLRSEQLVFCFVHEAVHPELIDALRARGARALACERVEGPGGIRPISRPMGEVAGRMAVQVGARYLERPNGGRGLLLGGIPGVHPARVSILGAGVVGWNAMRAAVGLGADVLVLDARSDRLRAVDDAMGGRVKTLEVSPANLEEALMVSDLVVGAVRSEGGPCPKLVSREQLGLMQRGAVVVDVSVDEGGCFETTRPGWHAEACREIDGVLHHAVPNMPGAVARTATPALSHAMLEVGLLVASLGLDEAIERQPSLGRAVVGA